MEGPAQARGQAADFLAEAGFCIDPIRFCEGLRTPAPGVRRTTVIGPASASLHNI
jgi:hypothetical protein